jgi:hypothetical protein
MSNRLAKHEKQRADNIFLSLAEVHTQHSHKVQKKASNTKNRWNSMKRYHQQLAQAHVRHLCTSVPAVAVQAVHAYGNTQARSRKHCCSWKAPSITDSDGVFVSLVIQHAMHMLHIVICGLSGFTIFFHVMSQSARLSGGGGILNIQRVFWVYLQLPSQTFLIISGTERDMIQVHRSAGQVPH